MVDRFLELVRSQGPTFAVRVGTAGLVLLAGYLLSKLAAKLAARALSRSEAAVAFSTVVPGAVRVVGVGIAGVMALDQLGLEIGTLLAGAGIVGLAIGFGSQAVVRDVVTGLFLIVDGAIKPGDYVKIGEAAGVVEHIGLRMTEVRGDAGELFYVANGTIGTVVNRSRGFARLAVDVPVPPGVALEAALASLQRIADAFAVELEDGVLEPPEAQGVYALEGDKAIVRVVAKVKADERERAALALRRRIHEQFVQAPPA
jgi:small conductance mechanosensitive channel